MVVTVYDGICKVQIRASPSHVLLPSDACGHYFTRLLMRAYTSATTVSTHWLRVLKPVCGSGLSWVVSQRWTVSTRLEFLAKITGLQVLLVVPQILNVLLWVGCLRWKIAAYSGAQFYCVMMGIHEDGWNFNGSTPSSFVTEISVVTFLIVFTTAVTRYHKKVTVWLANGYLRSQLRGAKVMVEQLVDLLIIEAKIEFAAGSIISMAIVLSLGMILVALELRQLTQTVASTVQGKRAALLIQDFIQELSVTKGVSFVLSHQFWLLHMVQQQLKGDSGQYNSGFTSSQLHRQAPKQLCVIEVAVSPLILEDKDVSKGKGMSCTYYM